MESVTSQMEADFLDPSPDLEALIGTLLLAVNAEVEADESHAEWSLAVWLQWLDEEGYPIKDAIERFCNQVSTTYREEFNSLKSELAVRINESSGLAVLFSTIDSQQPVIAESLHQFMEQAISKADETYRLAGGTHTKAYVVGGVTVFAVGVGIALKKRSNRLKREGLELERKASEGFRKMEAHIDELAKEAERDVMSSGELQNRAFMKTLGAKNMVLNEEALGKHNIQITLEKDAKDFTSREVERQIKMYAKSMAEDSARFMEENEKGIYDAARNAFKDELKLELIRKDDYSIRWLRVEGKKVAVKATPFGLIEHEIDEFPHHDAEAEKRAKEKIEKCFVEHYREATKKAFRLAKDSANAEGRRIEISFADAYKTVKREIWDDASKLAKKEEDAARRAGKVARNDADRAMQGMEEKAEIGAQKIEKDATRAIKEL